MVQKDTHFDITHMIREKGIIFPLIFNIFLKYNWKFGYYESTNLSFAKKLRLF